MKKTYYLLVGLWLLSTAFVAAQGRFSVSATAAPAYAHLSARLNYLQPVGNGQFESSVFSTNTSSFGYAAGVMGHYRFTPSWSVSTGVWYNRLGYEGPFPFAPGPISARIISQTTQVPLLVNYRSRQQRLSPYFSVGVLTSLRRSTLYRPDSNSGQTEAKVVFSRSDDYRPVVGAGIAYRVSTHVSLLVQPMLIWQFRPANDYDHFVAYQLNALTQLVYSF
ncbi:outer membrane beta-barrel protein [Spirosoma luteum]|uniref:outer membrane beta-barrel protein n=1 Tax=Spirosoma luteum TaxID=431553 RepID=UPI00036BADFB|nr:outer membrane beta-barrel protein [Spirosoma luteum]